MAALIVALAADARAARAGDDAAAGAAVDVDDLPPLPAAEGEPTRAAALASAADVEEDVVVGAAKREQSLGNVASAVTVISADRLRRFGYRTLSEALRGVAGLFIDDDHIDGRLGIRGLQVLGDFNTRILVLVDGATVNEPWDQFVGLDWDLPVAIDDVERIEVIRGPVSSVYGTNAFFGIINIITRNVAESPRAWARTTASSFGEVAQAAGFAVGDVNHQLRGTAAALYRAGEDVASAITPDLPSTRLADGMIGWHAALVGSYEGVFAQVRAFRRVRQLAYAPYDTMPGDHATHNIDSQVLAEGGYARTIGRLALVARGYIDRYQFTDYLVSAMPDQTPFEDLGDSFWYGGEVRGRYALAGGDRLGLTAGGEITHQHTRSQSSYEGMAGSPVDIPQGFNLGGVYAELDGRPLRWLAFTAGLRYDANDVLDDRLSPRAALFLSRDDDYGVKLLYAEGFRNPSAYEAFFHDDTSFVKPGHIDSETIRSYEAVLWGRPAPGLSARASVYRWRTDDRIGQGPAKDGSGLIEFQNLGRFDSTGVEVEGTYRTAGGWFGFGGGAYADVTAPGSSDPVVNAPALTGALGVSTPRLGGLAHLSTELVYVGSQHTRAVDDASGAPIDADAWLGWNVIVYAPDLHGLDVTVGVRNVLGRRQPVVASDDFDRHPDPANPDMTVVVPVVPGEGREIFARVGYRY
jgi:outer membrane receptor protein involved in Fe transport